MRRIRLRTGPAALFGAMLVAALIVFLPMRLALGWFGAETLGLTARAATGSVWDGRLLDARFGDLVLGDVEAGLSPLALLVGRARIAIDDGAALHGALAVSRHGRSIDDLTASLPTGRIFAPLPVTRLDLTDVTIHFGDDDCERAEGRVSAALVGDAAGVPLPAAVAGTPRCEGDALVLPLASQAGTERVTLRIAGDGRYTAALVLAAPDPIAAQRLASAGFVASPEGYRLSVEGSF